MSFVQVVGLGTQVVLTLAIASTVTQGLAHADRSTEVGAEESAKTGAFGGKGTGFGIHFMAEYFPSKSTEIDDGAVTVDQQSIFTGLRFSFPVLRKVPANVPEIYGEVAFGYAAGGAEAGNGEHGLALAAGAEGRWTLPQAPWLTPFARLELARRLTAFNDLPNATLFENAIALAGGAYLARSVELHVIAGSSYTGQAALGVGIGLGKLF